MQGFDDRFQAELRSILTLLGNGHQKPARNLPMPKVQEKTPDDVQRRCPKHVEFYNRINIWTIGASGWLLKRNFSGNQIRDDEMGRTYGMNEEKEIQNNSSLVAQN